MYILRVNHCLCFYPLNTSKAKPQTKCNRKFIQQRWNYNGKHS
uniref:Uncharacterized protein n=1 Tax=Arundo donax TaxID=35708 RepID=A0A0A8Z1G6_ARUDO